MSYKVFIDGQEGTTGLKIFDRFKNRTDIELLQIDPDLRKDLSERKNLINSSDFTFLCLPDAAAIEAVSLVQNDNTVILDASTAHRTNPEWTYGFPELSKEHRKKLANSKRIAVPGCYASGFIAIVYPLVKAGIISKEHPLICHALSGYSGGGKKMIEQYECPDKSQDLFSPRQYALSQNHKHLPEMQYVTGLTYKPMFNPIVDDYYSGMAVSVPLILRTLAKKTSTDEIHAILKKHYEGEKFVRVKEQNAESFLAANSLTGTDYMDIYINGNEEQTLICALLDNLGKGASSAAIQCMDVIIAEKSKFVS